MANTICLFGPPFSLAGEELYVNEVPSFSLKFNSLAEQNQVTRIEWYLNGILLSDLRTAEITIPVVIGKHVIAARILTGNGWSGVKHFQFKKLPEPVISLRGSATILEGGSAVFTITAKYQDNTTVDLTALYEFSAAEGVFQGSTLLMPNNTALGDNRPLIVSASRVGYDTLVKPIIVINTSQVVVSSIEIEGPNSVLEGGTATYQILATYSDNSKQHLSGYTFYTEEGTFSGNVLSVPENTIGGDQRVISIMATKPNAKPLSREITILDKPPIEFEEFDYLVLRFVWGLGDFSGVDLDIQVKYENNGTPSDNVYVGYPNADNPVGSPNYTVPSGPLPNSSAHLWWAGDGGSGNVTVEAVLIGIKNFINAYPSSPNVIELGIYASWYGDRNDGWFQLEMKTYLGGTMQKAANNLDFVNSNGVLVDTEEAYPETNYRQFKKVGILKYNKTSKIATLQVL